MIIKESDLCRDRFERTEAGFDRKHETMKGIKEAIREIVKPAIALGFVAALGTGCATAETEEFSLAIDCPEDSSLEVRDTDVQGIVELVCFSDRLNSDGELDKYSPISVVSIESLGSEENSDQYDSMLDFDVPYMHLPGSELLNKFTFSYDHQADPSIESFRFAEVPDGDGAYMDIGRNSINSIKVSELGE